MKHTSDFAANIRSELKNKKKNIAWLSRESGVSQCMLSYYLSGKTEPSLSKALSIASTLEVPLSKLVGENVFRSETLFLLASQDEYVKKELLKDSSDSMLLSELSSRLQKKNTKT